MASSSSLSGIWASFLKRYQGDATSSMNQPEVLDHWTSLVEFFQVSPADFYSQIESELQARKISGLNVSRVELQEGGVMSDKREYLRLTRERLTFDICTAPFGTGCFFSCRLIQPAVAINPLQVLVLLIAFGLLLNLLIKVFGFFMGIFILMSVLIGGVLLMRNAVGMGLRDIDTALMNSPIISSIYERFFRKETYYRIDTRLMYLQTVPDLVKGVAEKVTAAKGVKLVKQYERKPVLGDLYQRVQQPSPAVA